MTVAIDVPVLTGSTCLLRPLTLADAPHLQRYADDEAVWRNLFEGFPRPYTLADAQGWCSVGSKTPAAGYVWGIEVDSHVIGCISLRPDSGWLRCNAEVGYWVGQPYWRRGITSDALRQISAWAWTALPDLTRLYAPIFAWNQGSQAVARSCGYHLEGEFKRSAIKAGVVIDRVLWATQRPGA